MNQRVSMLMDGELENPEAVAVLTELKQQELRQQWLTYHLIGDAMRGAPVVLSPEFSARLAERLAAEPAILALRRSAASSRPVMIALSAAASIAAVVVVGWMTLQMTAPHQPAPGGLAAASPDSPPLAQAGAPLNVNNAYLIAHQEFSPSTAMHGVVPYVRTVAELDRNPAR